MKKKQLAFVFPGQGSQSIGMLKDISQTYKAIKDRFDQASDVLHKDLWQLVQLGPAEQLNSTENTQPILLASSIAIWDICLEIGCPTPTKLAGHSFGEYSALVCSEVISYEDALVLVAARGKYMQEAAPKDNGSMAAILGLSLEALEPICAESSCNGESCEPANLNSRQQIVVAGTTKGVERTCEIATARGAKKTVPLKVSAPAHSQLMLPAAEKLSEMINRISFFTPKIEIVHNYDVSTHDDPEAIKNALIKQMTHPVRWYETVENLASSGVTQIVECGPGNVLSGLIKRTDKTIQCIRGDDPLAVIESLAS